MSLAGPLITLCETQEGVGKVDDADMEACIPVPYSIIDIQECNNEWKRTASHQGGIDGWIVRLT